MIDWKVGVGLCFTLSSIVAALPATAQQFNSQQTIIIEQATAFVCNTVKQAKGKVSDVKIGGEVDAHLNGIVGKLVNAGGSGGGSWSGEKYKGLSQDATAAAFEGDRNCRERVFLTMLDKLTAVAPPAPAGTPAVAPPAPAGTPPASNRLTCVVSDPTPTPLNVRASPNGVIKNHLHNGNHVQPLRFATAANGTTWAYVSNTADQGIGWVFFPYLTC